METAWYFRLFFVNVSWFAISWLLFGIIKAKRMSGPGPSKAGVIAFLDSPLGRMGIDMVCHL